MPEFNLKRESLNTITDVEIAFGTTKLLPPFDAVPDESKRGNDYTRLLDHLFSGRPVPEGEIVFREGFDDTEAPALLNRVVMAHLATIEAVGVCPPCKLVTRFHYRLHDDMRISGPTDEGWATWQARSSIFDRLRKFALRAIS